MRLFATPWTITHQAHLSRHILGQKPLLFPERSSQSGDGAGLTEPDSSRYELTWLCKETVKILWTLQQVVDLVITAKEWLIGLFWKNIQFYIHMCIIKESSPTDDSEQRKDRGRVVNAFSSWHLLVVWQLKACGPENALIWIHDNIEFCITEYWKRYIWLACMVGLISDPSGSGSQISNCPIQTIWKVLMLNCWTHVSGFLIQSIWGETENLHFYW